MVLGMSDIQLVVVWLGALLFALVGIATSFAALYFVVRNAVLAALRKHDAEKMGLGTQV